MASKLRRKSETLGSVLQGGVFVPTTLFLLGSMKATSLMENAMRVKNRLKLLAEKFTTIITENDFNKGVKKKRRNTETSCLW